MYRLLPNHAALPRCGGWGGGKEVEPEEGVPPPDAEAHWAAAAATAGDKSPSAQEAPPEAEQS